MLARQTQSPKLLQVASQDTQFSDGLTCSQLHTNRSCWLASHLPMADLVSTFLRIIETWKGPGGAFKFFFCPTRVTACGIEHQRAIQHQSRPETSTSGLKQSRHVSYTTKPQQMYRKPADHISQDILVEVSPKLSSQQEDCQNIDSSKEQSGLSEERANMTFDLPTCEASGVTPFTRMRPFRTANRKRQMQPSLYLHCDTC